MTDKEDDQDRENYTEAEIYYGDQDEAMKAFLDDLKHLGEAGWGDAAWFWLAQQKNFTNCQCRPVCLRDRRHTCPRA